MFETRTGLSIRKIQRLYGCALAVVFIHFALPLLPLSQGFQLLNGRELSHGRTRRVVLSAKNKQSKAGRTNQPSGFGRVVTSSTSSASNVPSTRSLGAGRNVGSGTKALRKAANLFDEIRKEHGVEACRDVYIRAPLNSPTTFWFAGKIAFRNSPTFAVNNNDGQENAGENQPTLLISPAHAAAIAQKRIILEYAKLELRPQNLGGRYSTNLELWLAPGDSEMDVVQNKVRLERVQGAAQDLPSDFDLTSVGFNPEIYVGDERTQGGLRVERDENGCPTKPVFEVNQSI